MPLEDIKYLSEKRISDLNKLGVKTTLDLAKYFPRAYLDLTKITNISSAYHNDVVLTIAKIETEPRQFSSSRIKYVKVYCSQGADMFSIVWFNQPYVLNKLKQGEEYLFYGRVSNKYGNVSMTNPVFEQVDKNYKLKGIVPVYTIKGSLTESLMKTVCLSAVNKLELKSVIPENLQNKYQLYPLKTAYNKIHNPLSKTEIDEASYRIALEEYFSMITAFKVIKGDKKCARTAKYGCSAIELKEFSKRFEFEFTDGQKQAVNQIYKDLKSPFSMNRLLQGDVGCGKTAVAFCAIYMAVKSGYQATLLAPTEVLAEQSFALIKKYFSDFNCAYLSSSVKAKDKKDIKEKLLSGEVQIAVGTHALLQGDITFKNLSLCVCDEQQRFGVAQRTALKDKGLNVDMLVMSATPIPRTLSLIFYGDLDISTILDKPKLRAQILTSIVNENKYHDMLKFVGKELKEGRQAYFVCPKIDGDDEGSIISVKELFDELKTFYPLYNIGLLHGKLKDSEKSAIMLDFKNRKYDILVSTTVIEVGVDVANATVMAIYNAERFGLSQLHQLRGRVGRSNLNSYCFLITGSDSDKAIERLSAIKDCSDGFKISEIDYDIRGGGDFLGERQSGKFLSELGGLKYPSSVIFLAKRLSDEAFDCGANIEMIKEIAKKYYFKLKNVTLN